MNWRTLAFTILSPPAGIAILYHEVWVADNSELFLVLLGLWLTGAPLARFLDVLNRAGRFAETLEDIEKDTELQADIEELGKSS
jgi:hypothetical protein